MKAHKLILVTLVAALGIVAAFQPTPVPSTYAESWPFSNNDCPTFGVEQYNIPKFDTQGGTRTLLSVKVNLQFDSVFATGIEALDTTGDSSCHPWCNYAGIPGAGDWGEPGDNTYSCAAYMFSSTNQFLMNSQRNVPPIAEMGLVTLPYDGTLDFDGTSGSFLEQGIDNDTVAGTPKTNAGLLAAVSGSGYTTLELSYSTGSWVNPASMCISNPYCAVDAEGSVSGTVVYTWQ